MISPRCPKCRSSRIRKGYKPTPLILRLFGIHHLLCNHCNLLFTGFAVRGIGGKSKRKGRGKETKQRDLGLDGLSRAEDNRV